MSVPGLGLRASAGDGGDAVNHFALAAPAGTPRVIVKRLNAAIRQIVARPDVLARFKTDAMEPATGSLASMGQFIAADYRAWRDMVTTRNLKIE